MNLVHADVLVSIYFQERIQLETSRLYRQAGVNPLAGTPLVLKLKLPLFFWQLANHDLLLHFGDYESLKWRNSLSPDFSPA